jgi:hypothetical protein
MNNESPQSASLASQLCSGNGIEYKAFARVLFPESGAAVVCVLANCSFPHTGFTLSFENSNGLALMQTLGPGRFSHLINSCGAGWSSSFASAPPKTVVVRDSYGEHTIPVMGW